MIVKNNFLLSICFKDLYNYKAGSSFHDTIHYNLYNCNWSVKRYSSVRPELLPNSLNRKASIYNLNEVQIIWTRT